MIIVLTSVIMGAIGIVTGAGERGSSHWGAAGII